MIILLPSFLIAIESVISADRQESKHGPWTITSIINNKSNPQKPNYERYRISNKQICKSGHFVTNNHFIPSFLRRLNFRHYLIPEFTTFFKKSKKVPDKKRGRLPPNVSQLRPTPRCNPRPKWVLRLLPVIGVLARFQYFLLRRA